MTNLYHDQLDAFEARVRAEAEENELNNAGNSTIELIEKIDAEIEKAAALLRVLQQFEGSDTSMTQLNDAGFGSQGVF
jgi:HPt (histidine-containing phosphotransfer) domain-containing protein